MDLVAQDAADSSELARVWPKQSVITSTSWLVLARGPPTSPQLVCRPLTPGPRAFTLCVHLFSVFETVVQPFGLTSRFARRSLRTPQARWLIDDNGNCRRPHFRQPPLCCGFRSLLTRSYAQAQGQPPPRSDREVSRARQQIARAIGRNRTVPEEREKLFVGGGQQGVNSLELKLELGPERDQANMN